MKKILISAVLGLSLMTGCHNTVTAAPPPLINQVNDFDGQSYRALITLQGSLNSLADSINADPSLKSLKAPVQAASQDYQIAVSAWKIYHSSQSNQQDVTDTLKKAQTDVSNLQNEVKK